jgi:hypothetical protein
MKSIFDIIFNILGLIVFLSIIWNSLKDILKKDTNVGLLIMRVLAIIVSIYYIIQIVGRLI